MDALAGSLADGSTEGLLAAYDVYADRLYVYSRVLLADEDAAAAAVHDALLVAAGRAPGLPLTTPLGPWLYALTRNECLRRRPGRTVPSRERELVELARRHRLATADIAAVLGIEVSEAEQALAGLPAACRLDPLPALNPPAALRHRLAAADRAAAARQAGPFRANGFPHPLDRRRVSGRMLAASIVVVVLGALGLLTVVPGDGTGASGAAATGSAAAAAAAAPAGRPFAEPSSWPAPNPAPATSLRPLDRPAAPARGTGTPGLGGPDSAPLADQAAGRELVGWLENRTVPDCPRRWVARVHVTVVGVEAAQVVATWFDGSDIQTVSLRSHDRDWEGELAGLPVGKLLWWRAGATTTDGVTVTTAQQPLSYVCGR